MLLSLVRLVDYMLTESFVSMALNNLAKLLSAMEHPDPKSKGIFSTSVAFAHDLTTFAPNEKEVLETVNGVVLDGIVQAVGAMRRLAFARAFAPSSRWARDPTARSTTPRPKSSKAWRPWPCSSRTRGGSACAGRG